MSRRRAVSNPEKYCPICGARGTLGHRCDPRTLRAIDAALASDPPDSREIPEGERLAAGFAMLAEGDD